MGATIGDWIALTATIVAGVAAFFSFRTAQATLMVARSTQDLAAGGVLVNLLAAYGSLRNSADQALQNKDLGLCRAYYRQYFDLLWTEFQLWRRGLIPNSIMHAWLLAVHRSYRDQAFPYRAQDSSEAQLTHKEAWDHAMRELYFDQQDPFVTFVEHVYHEPAINIEQLRRQFQVDLDK